MCPELSISREKLGDFLPVLGTEVTDEGHLRNIESGELLINDETGEPWDVDEIGYIGHGSVEPVENNFGSVVSHLSDREFDNE